jgi:hypothetical protein
MRRLFLALAPVLLAGCAIHGSWLDEIGKPPRPPVAMDDAQARQLAQEASELRARAEAIRLQLARETDRRQRFRHYEALRKLDDDLVPLERALIDAGRPARKAIAPAAAA